MAIQGCGPLVGARPVFGRGQHPSLSREQAAYVDEAIKDYSTLGGTFRRLNRARKVEALRRVQERPSKARKGWTA